jgi:tetratricopeptide (TPR) repeat protein
MRKLPIFCLLLAALWAGCTQDPSDQISALENALAASFQESTLDSLITAYEQGIQGNAGSPEKLHYASQLAVLKYDHKGDGSSAVQVLNEALGKYSKGQNLTESIGVLAKLWTGYIYKAEPTHKLYPEDIDLMKANLQKNTAWLDSNLVLLSTGMMNTQTGAMDKAKADKFIEVSEAYGNIAMSMNQRDKFVEIMLKAAGVAKSIGNSNKALQMYYQVENTFPNHPKAPTALFMSGFIYENDLQDLEQAKAMYEQFLERYPNDPDYTDDAQQALKYLGKTPEELIREFEKNAQEQ